MRFAGTGIRRDISAGLTPSEVIANALCDSVPPPPDKHRGLPLMEAFAGRRSSRDFARNARVGLRIYQRRGDEIRADEVACPRALLQALLQSGN